MFPRFLAAACVLLSVPAMAQDPSQSPSLLKPEMIIHFKNRTLACLERANLAEIIAHVNKGEKTKTEAMMINHGGTCLILLPTTRFKILSVDYNDPNVGADIAVLEIVGEGVITGHGAWTFSIDAEPVARPSKKQR